MSRTCTFTPQVVTGFSCAHDRSVIFSYLVLISDSPLYQNVCKLHLRPLATSPSRQMSTQPQPSPLPKFPLSGVALMRLVAQCEMRNKKGKRRCCQVPSFLFFPVLLTYLYSCRLSLTSMVFVQRSIQFFHRQNFDYWHQRRLCRRLHIRTVTSGLIYLAEALLFHVRAVLTAHIALIDCTCISKWSTY